MKRRLRRLIVFAGVLGLVMAVNVGVASADHGATAPAFEEAEDNDGTPPEDALLTPGAIPVGSHLLESPTGVLPPGNPGSVNGFEPRPDSGAIAAIANNPNCPAHYAP